MNSYKIYEEIENDKYFLDATHPDIPNWTKTISSSLKFGTITDVLELINYRIDELIVEQKNRVEIKRTKNEFNFQYETFSKEKEERNEYLCKIYYVKQ